MHSAGSVKEIILKTELYCKSDYLDNIAQDIYLFNVGLRQIYSVLSFSEQKLKFWVSPSVQRKFLKRGKWRKKFNVNQSFQTTMHRIVTYSKLFYFT